MTAPKDYKSTLNLPETPFPMQANLAKRQPEILARWELEKIYRQVKRAGEGLTAYCFVDVLPLAHCGGQTRQHCAGLKRGTC